MISTEAWVLRPGDANVETQPGLTLEEFSFADITDDEVLVEPLLGCWEGNMGHALARRPVDVCRQRGEEAVVIGNAGVVRVIRIGRRVSEVRPDDLAIVFCNGSWDEQGFVIGVLGYDAPGTIGVLAKRTKLHRRQLIRIPPSTRYDIARWAGFSLRYVTAWTNWRVAYACWLAQMSHVAPSDTYVLAWGGGVAFAEALLARHFGCCASIISSQRNRLELFKEHGLNAIDRAPFSDLHFDGVRYETDRDYRAAYLEAERRFLRLVTGITDGRRASVFIDNIGAPVVRATLKSLGRGGVITTAGWKEGMSISLIRALECMHRHVHVHTHYARYEEGLDAVAFAERHGWLPPSPARLYGWEEIPVLAEAYARGEETSLFPMFVVNA